MFYILSVLQAVKDSMSVRRVSPMYKIPREILHDKIKGQTPIQCSMSHRYPAYLTAEGEKDIVQ